MYKRFMAFFIFLLTVTLFPLVGTAANKPVGRGQGADRLHQRKNNNEGVYGSYLMTDKERTEHQAKMRNLKTKKERDAYRLEHRKHMDARARGNRQNDGRRNDRKRSNSRMNDGSSRGTRREEMRHNRRENMHNRRDGMGSGRGRR